MRLILIKGEKDDSFFIPGRVRPFCFSSFRDIYKRKFKREIFVRLKNLRSVSRHKLGPGMDFLFPAVVKKNGFN
jgi:hypothetical protein